MLSAQARAARAMLQLTISDAADLMGVTPNTLSRVEQDNFGRRGRPNATTMRAIRQVYEERGIEFLDGEGPGVRLWKDIPPAG